MIIKIIQILSDHFTYIEYDKDKVNEKLDYIFQRLFKEKYLDCKFIYSFENVSLKNVL